MVTDRIALAADLHSPRAGRRFARHCLNGLDSDTVETAVLLVSELVTNAVIHGGPHRPDATVGLSVELADDSVRLAVTDGGAGNLVVGNGAPDRPSGRGLVLVEHFALRWGCRRHATGKTVWVDIPRPTWRGNVDGNGR